MILYEYININYDTIRRETNIGLMPVSVLFHWRAYSKMDAYIKMGYKVNDAIMAVSCEERISERTAFRIKKRMEEKI